MAASGDADPLHDLGRYHKARQLTGTRIVGEDEKLPVRVREPEPSHHHERDRVILVGGDVPCTAFYDIWVPRSHAAPPQILDGAGSDPSPPKD